MSIFVKSFSIKGLRKSLGMSLTDFATVIGLSGANASDVVRRMESGSPPSGPIERVLSYLVQTADIDAAPGLATHTRQLPKWAICRSLEPRGGEYFMHNAWPRFYAVVTKDLTSLELDELSAAKVPALPLKVAGLAPHLVILFVDLPVVDVDRVLEEAVRLVETHHNRGAD